MKTEFKKSERELEAFELKPYYYVKSWINGNKGHVISEIKELIKCSPASGFSILFDIVADKKKIGKEMLNFNDGELMKFYIRNDSIIHTSYKVY